MSFSGKSAAIAAAFSLMLIGCASAKPSPSVDDYANQTPYGDPKSTKIKEAPSGYSMIFLQNIGRHGARPLTSDTREQNVLDIWTAAAKNKALTKTGAALATDIRSFQKAERKIGYGRLTGVGKKEWAGIGRRTAVNYKPFFKSVEKKNEKINNLTTDSTRTKQSTDALRDGLVSTLSGLDVSSLLAKPVEADKLMHFSNSASSAGKAAISQTEARPAARAHALNLLTTLYTTNFANTIKDPVSAALDVYRLYSTAPGLADETDVTFSRYVPPEDREMLSYLTDTSNFYKYGPGVTGESKSFDDARPLLADFFSRLDQRIAGGSTAAVMRVAHGETTMPFAALIKAPGSTEQVPKGQRYSRTDNEWRGAKAGKLAGNLEWAAYRNKDKKVLVTMRYNEVPAKFSSDCTPYKKGSYFYTVSELKRCLG